MINKVYSPVPELSFLPAQYRGWTRPPACPNSAREERRVQGLDYKVYSDGTVAVSVECFFRNPDWCTDKELFFVWKTTPWNWIARSIISEYLSPGSPVPGPKSRAILDFNFREDPGVEFVERKLRLRVLLFFSRLVVLSPVLSLYLPLPGNWFCDKVR